MQLVSFTQSGPDRSVRVGLLNGDGIVDVSDLVSSMSAVIVGGDELLRQLEAAGRDRDAFAASGVQLLAPLPHPVNHVYCVGWNYRKHFEEGIGKRGDHEVEALPERPTFFTKAPGAVIGPGVDVPLDPQLTEQLDYEAEIAVIIGRGGRSIPESVALEHVFGYTLANDVSARDLQKAHGGQWLRGKGLDGTCPLGPAITTRDAVADIAALTLEARVNGELRQSATTAAMIFSIPRLISELSRGLTLAAGDILLTGTPDGIGMARTPPVFLRAGDVIEVSCAPLGVLTNTVAARDLSAYEPAPAGRA